MVNTLLVNDDHVCDFHPLTDHITKFFSNTNMMVDERVP